MSKNNRRGIIITILVGGLLFILLFILGIVPKISRNKKNESLAKQKKEQQIAVQSIKIDMTADTTGINLPADIKAFKETFIYARVNGYVKKWYTDIGTYVKKGQLIAELETPDLDQSLLQAKANLMFAKSNLDKVDSVTLPGAVSRQEIDQFKSAYKANLAQVRQLESTTNFKRVIAPFDGIVTMRNIDQGTLITAGSTQPMFKVEQVDILRIFINVPQNYIQSATIGLSADVWLEKSILKKRTGKVVRTSKSLDPSSRTLLTEIQLINKDHGYMPGMYVTVHLKPQVENKSLLIPANSLITRANGTQVATINPSNHIVLKTIKIGRDYGKTLQIISGLNRGEKIVINPTDKIYDGVRVHILPESKNKNEISQKTAH